MESSHNVYVLQVRIVHTYRGCHIHMGFWLPLKLALPAYTLPRILAHTHTCTCTRTLTRTSATFAGTHFCIHACTHTRMHACLNAHVCARACMLARMCTALMHCFCFFPHARMLMPSCAPLHALAMRGLSTFVLKIVWAHLGYIPGTQGPLRAYSKYSFQSYSML